MVLIFSVKATTTDTYLLLFSHWIFSLEIVFFPIYKLVHHPNLQIQCLFTPTVVPALADLLPCNLPTCS
jgi:hypothetical protein